MNSSPESVLWRHNRQRRASRIAENFPKCDDVALSVWKVHSILPNTNALFIDVHCSNIAWMHRLQVYLLSHFTGTEESRLVNSISIRWNVLASGRLIVAFYTPLDNDIFVHVGHNTKSDDASEARSRSRRAWDATELGRTQPLYGLHSVRFQGFRMHQPCVYRGNSNNSE